MKSKFFSKCRLSGSVLLLSCILSLSSATRGSAEAEDSAAPKSRVQENAFEPELARSDEQETLLIDNQSYGKQPSLSSRLPLKVQRAELNEACKSPKYKPGIPCVPLMLIDDPNTLIVSDRDANIKAEKRNIVMTRGKGVYMVGKLPIVVDTPLGSVTLAGNSAAIIEQAENGLLRVDHLTGPASTVAVKRWKGVKAFTASSGEEICLAPKSLSPSELVPQDGVERQEVATEAGADGINFSENKFVPKTMLDKECLLQCDNNSFFQMRRKVYQLRKDIDSQETATVPDSPNHTDSVEPSPVLIFVSQGDAEEQVRPVNFSEPSQLVLPLISQETISALLKYNSRTEIACGHPSVTELKNGELLISSNKPAYLKTPHSLIKVEPGTLVLVSVNDDVTKLRTLWEDRRNGVTQYVGGQPFNVAAGDESLVGDELRSIYLAASKDMVGRRLSHYSELPDGHVVHFSEVSLISLAQSSDLLSQLQNSSDPSDQALTRKLNKMAAILVQISASHGFYELMQPLQWKRDARTSSSSLLF